MTRMHVEFYERMWMWAAGVLIVSVLGLIGYAALAQGSVPPSHVETIDPTTVRTDPRFAERGVVERADGTVLVTMIGARFAFFPNEVRVPAGRAVTFRVTSTDVVHGFQIVGSNANTMVIPGYVSQFTTVFDTPGEYLIVCNEYCGTAHHVMSATLIVEGE
jgi:cytochrome c oxidase subunit II